MSMPFKCPTCGFIMPRQLFNCPACKAFLIDMTEQAAPPPAPPTWSEIALLLSAIPVLAPSLLLSWLDPRHLGRAQLAIHAAGALAALAWLRGGSLSVSLWVLSAGAAALLAVRRLPLLDRGIFIGFSSGVALRMVAGMLFIAGLGSVETWYQIGRTLDFARNDAVTAADLPGPRGQAGGAVTLNGAELDEADRIWRAEVKGATRFYRSDPRVPFAAPSPQALLDRQADLIGLEVDVGAIAPEPDHFIRKDVTFRGGGPTMRDIGTRAFGAIPGIGARLWLASAPIATGQAPVLFPRPGLLVQVNNDAAFIGEHLARSREIPPDASLSVLSGDRLGATGVERWVPVKGTGRRIWIAAPGDAVVRGAGAFTGAILPGYWAVKLLAEHLARQGDGREAPQGIVVIMQAGTSGFDEYASDMFTVTVNDFKIVLVPILLLLLLGTGSLGAGIRLARRAP